MGAMFPVTLAFFVLMIAFLLRAREIERDRRLVCQIVPKLLYTRRTWRLRIANESNSVMTLGEVVVSGRMATSIHAEQAKVNVGTIMLPSGQCAVFDLEPPLLELLEKHGQRQGFAASVLDVTIDIHHLVKSKRRMRTVRFVAVCDRGCLVNVLAQPATDLGLIKVSVPVQDFRATR